VPEENTEKEEDRIQYKLFVAMVIWYLWWELEMTGTDNQLVKKREGPAAVVLRGVGLSFTAWHLKWSQYIFVGNIPEVWGPQLYRGGSLTFRINWSINIKKETEKFRK
jgi:hypothetical protein